MKYRNTDKGNCRTYFTHDKKLYTYQESIEGGYEFYICSLDGEPHDLREPIPIPAVETDCCSDKLFDYLVNEKLIQWAQPIKKKKPYAPDWEETEPGIEYSKSHNIYWDGVKCYDPRSAEHNGIIGLGRQLLKVVNKCK